MNPHDDERGALIVAGGNRFALVAAVRTRANEIARGAPPRVGTESIKPVTIAIQEAARGRMHIGASTQSSSPIAHVAQRVETDEAPFWWIDCRDCAKTVAVRRKVGMPLQGRPPTRCASCGISPNWEQIDK